MKVRARARLGARRPLAISAPSQAWRRRLFLRDMRRRARERRRRLDEQRAADLREKQEAERLPAADGQGLGEAPTFRSIPIDPQLLRPGGLEATVICRWGSTIVYVRATPETLTPAWWRARVPGGFHLVLHPMGVGGVRGDAARGLRECIDLGMWPGRGHLPTMPIGDAPTEVVIRAPGGAVRATRTAGQGSRPEYVVAPVDWDRAAPRRQAVAAAEVYVDEPGRPRRIFTRGETVDGLTVYRPKRKS